MIVQELSSLGGGLRSLSALVNIIVCDVLFTSSAMFASLLLPQGDN